MRAYDDIGRSYARQRRPDHRIGTAIAAALGDAEAIVNVGAGTGSYEPGDRAVIAIEPSEVMIRQRMTSAAPCIQAAAENLPLDAASFDAAMAILTIHHWSDVAAGLREMRRVARRRVVILTWVPDAPSFWLTADYFPQILDYDRKQFPTTAELENLLQATIALPSMTIVPIPHDCTDGFLGAYWRRPGDYLSELTRSGISSFSRFDASDGLARLSDDIASGYWAKRNAALLGLDQIDLGYRLLRCEFA